MSTRPPGDRTARWLTCGLALIVCASCGTSPKPNPQRYAPDPKDARRALEQALGAWRDSPQLERTVSATRPVMFVDQQRKRYQRLREFTVLGETPGTSALRQYRVQLYLEEPAESKLVSYYVFGQGPFWVYRAEDLDMLMHMDHSMMAASSSNAELADPEEPMEEAPERHQHHSPGKLSESETGSQTAPR